MTTTLMPGTGQVYAFDTQGTMAPKVAFANVAAATTDGAVITAVALKKLRIIGFILSPGATATAVTFNSKPGGAGVAISATFTCVANTTNVAPIHPIGWFTTLIGEGLTVTTGAGATVGVHVVYLEV